jgi:ABC-type glycerol-3-phosphate transport system permease component
MRLLRRGWMYAAMLAVSAFALFPVYWVAITSLKPRSEIYTRTPDLWPSDPQWHQYPRVLGEGHVGRGDTDWGAIMAASIIYTLPVVVVFIVLRKHLMTGTTAGAVKG